MANQKTPEEIAAEKEKAAAEKAEKEKAAVEKAGKLVEVTLRCRLFWKGRRKKEFEEIAVTPEEKKQLEAAGQLASKEDIEKLKNGEEIQNQ